jgi:predicted esterase
VDDEKVPVELGRKAAEFLKDVGVKVTWKEYESLGHWYNTDMLRDVIAFLKGLEGWEDADTAKD